MLGYNIKISLEMITPTEIRIEVLNHGDVLDSRTVPLSSLLQEISKIDRALSIFLEEPIEPFLPYVSRILEEGRGPGKIFITADTH